MRRFVDRRSAIPRLGAAAIAVLACLPAAAAGPPEPPSPRRPNIVFFLCDDLGSGDLGVSGSRDIRTPNIDALFARGATLSRHWAGSAVCAPSRCVLLTGRHPGHAVIRSNREVRPEGQFPMPAGTVTLAGILRTAGYATGGFGKWGLGPPGSPADPLACGFDRFFGYNCQREAHSFYPDHLWDDRERITLDNRSLAGDPTVARGGVIPAGPPRSADFARFAGERYSADLIADRQIDFVRGHAGRPFFLYVATTLPHLALQVPTDEPSLAHYVEHFAGEPPYLGGQGYVPCRRPLATYAAMVTRMDREVGRLVGLLDELGIADDTIFVFSSDNGAARPGSGGLDTARLRSNGPLRDWKGSPYEGGLRVPTAIVWPGRIPAGSRIDAATGFEDWLPTLLDLAGLQDRIPAAADGVSLAAALTDAGDAPADRSLYRELAEGGWQAVTDGRWKGVRRAAGGGGAERAEATELYDLLADPAETQDLAREHPDVVSRLEGIMDREHVPHPDWPLPFADLAAQQAPPAGQPARPVAARGTSAAARPPARRPNILFILTDDQSPFDLRLYDPESRLETPVIDSLAARGVVLDAAYHMGSFLGAVCTPSRHMIMTGRSLWHLPIGPGGDDTEPPPPGPHCPAGIEDDVLAAVFNRAGYDTMRTCKRGNSYEAANRRFTVRHEAVKRGGTAETGSAWHADRVLDFLSAREAAGDTDPFLVYFGFSHPHDTRDGTPELLAKYGATNHVDSTRPPPRHDRQPPLPLAWLPRHPFDDTHLDVRDEVAVSGVWRKRDESTIRNELGREFACSENIDVQIGRVLDKLAALGELENTWIFFTSDHGMAMGRHGLVGKQNLYEHTWRVPLVVAGPGVAAGRRAPGNVYLSDVLATLCDIAGIEPPATNEGTSFLPVLTGAVPRVREVLYGAYAGGAKPGIRCVRQGDWKLLKYESPAGGLVTQLFNLRENPQEFLTEHRDPAVAATSHARPTAAQRNLADDPAHAAKRAEMEAVLLAEMRRLDDPGRFSDQLAGPAGGPPAREPTAAAARPNIVLFLADDLGYGELGCYGNASAITPNLDRFAAGGLRLTDCHSASSVCSPSRSSLLTGRTPSRNGVVTWIPEDSPIHLRRTERALPRLLREAGYDTCHVGKWHLNGKFNSPEQPQPSDHGYAWWLATQNNADPSHAFPTNFVRNGAAIGRIDDHSAPFVAREAVTWLKTRRDPAKPFFLAVWTHEPHYPIASAERYERLHAGIADPVERTYRANVTQLDDAFGTVLKALADLGLADDTLVFFTSDNGPEGDGVKGPGRGLTGGLRGRKRSLYEGGIRVPGILRFPGRIEPGGVSDLPVIGSDFFSTALAAAGVALPAGVTLDGVNLLPAFVGEPVERTVPMHWRWRGKVAWREGDWKLVADESLARPELYDLARDRAEATDLAGAEAERLAGMLERLRAFMADCEAEGPRWPAAESPPVHETKAAPPAR